MFKNNYKFFFFFFLYHFLEWLISPTLAWQSLQHLWQMILFLRCVFQWGVWGGEDGEYEADPTVSSRRQWAALVDRTADPGGEPRHGRYVGGVPLYGCVHTLKLLHLSLSISKLCSRHLWVLFNTLWLLAVLGMSMSQASIFAQSSLILNYSHNKLTKPYKHCFIPKEKWTFLLSNCIKHHAMWTYAVCKLRMWKTHIASHFKSFSSERWKKCIFGIELFISCFYRLPCSMCSGNLWTRSILIIRKVPLHRFKR